jgi:hypothetical protein
LKFDSGQTPKEKAKELTNSFYRIIPLDKMTIDYNLAKQCALIAIDEIINEYPNAKPMIVYMTNPRIRYWQEVKQEIEKL